MMKKIGAVALLVLFCLGTAEAGNFRIRAREQWETGRLNFADARGNLNFQGLASVFNIWYEEPFKHAFGLSVERGGLRRNAQEEKATLTTVGIEAKYFPIPSLKPLFARAGFLASALDPAGPPKDGWAYGPTLGIGGEFLVKKFAIAPEVGGKLRWGARGRRWHSFYLALGLHFYVFPGDAAEGG